MTPISEREIALLDAMKTIAEVLMAMSPGAAKALAQNFDLQRKEHRKRGHQDAADVFAVLQEFVEDPRRQAQRIQIQRLLSEPPQGQA